MGAIERQVPQVKRKNSTSCRLPEARITVEGSVASKSGPREVGAGGGTSSVGADSFVDTIGGSVANGTDGCSVIKGDSLAAGSGVTSGSSVCGGFPAEPQAESTNTSDKRMVTFNFNFIIVLSQVLALYLTN